MHALNLFIIFIFIAWLVPLGVFIKPSQQSVACGGQRAVCLCRINTTSPKPIEGIVWQKTLPHHDENPSAGAPHYLAGKALTAQRGIELALYFKNQLLQYNDPLLPAPEHVPLA